MGFVALLRLSLHTGCGGLLTGLVDAFGLLFVGGCGCCCRRCCSLEARWHRDGELVVVRSSAESIGEAAHVGALLAVQPVGGRVREIDLERNGRVICQRDFQSTELRASKEN